MRRLKLRQEYVVSRSFRLRVLDAHANDLSCRPKLVGVKKKLDRREATRERKALAAAKLEKSIAAELLERLKSKAYGDAPLNVNEDVWRMVLDREKAGTDGVELEDEESEEEEELEEEMEDEEGLGDREFVSDVSGDEDDLSDLEDAFVSTLVFPLMGASILITLTVRGRGWRRRRGRFGGRVWRGRRTDGQNCIGQAESSRKIAKATKKGPREEGEARSESGSRVRAGVGDGPAHKRGPGELVTALEHARHIARAASVPSISQHIPHKQLV